VLAGPISFEQAAFHIDGLKASWCIENIWRSCTGIKITVGRNYSMYVA